MKPAHGGMDRAQGREIRRWLGARQRCARARAGRIAGWQRIPRRVIRAVKWVRKREGAGERAAAHTMAPASDADSNRMSLVSARDARLLEDEAHLDMSLESPSTSPTSCRGSAKSDNSNVSEHVLSSRGYACRASAHEHMPNHSLQCGRAAW